MVGEEAAEFQHAGARIGAGRRRQRMPEIQRIVEHNFIAEVFLEQQLPNTAVFHKGHTVADAEGLFVMVADI